MASGTINTKRGISGSISGISKGATGVVTSGSGVSDHNRLTNRDAANQHPISAITDLKEILNNKLDADTALPLIEEATNGKAKGLYYDVNTELDTKSYWYVTSEIDPVTKLGTKDSIISGPYNLGQGGGGGGSSSLTDVIITNIDPETGKSLWPVVISEGGKCDIQVYWSSTKNGSATGKGIMSLYVNGNHILNKSVSQGYVTLELSEILNSGNNEIEVKVVDAYSTKANFISSINVISLELKSGFDYTRKYNSTVDYQYIPVGDVDKNVHFYVDGSLYTTTLVKTSNESKTQKITNLSHGHHTLKVYFTCNVNGDIVKSNELYYDLIIVDENNNMPIIASQFTKINQEQYIPFNIPYRVYNPEDVTSQVRLYVGSELVKTLTVDRYETFWEYKNDVPGDYTLYIKTSNSSGEVVRQFDIKVEKSLVNVETVVEDLALGLTSYGRSNDESPEERIKWEDVTNNVSCILNNFNFSSNGWVKDSENNTVLRISGDARVEIPYKPFLVEPKFTGKTIEIELSTNTVRNYETVIIDCFSDNRGFYITPQIAVLKSQQTSLQTQYKEDDHVRLTFVVEKLTDNKVVYMYINGIASGAVMYSDDDSFKQLTAKNILIGSNEANIDIYSIRIYDNNLNRKQIVENWIADTQDSALRARRFYRNDNYNDKGEIVIDKLPSDLSYLITDINPLPQYKGDKRPGNVKFVDPVDDSRSFTSRGSQHNVQGTSSSVYPVKNWKIAFNKRDGQKIKEGFIATDGTTYAKFPIREGQIGANEFTYKVDYASSEGANNVELVRLYNDVSKEQNILTPPQKVNSKIRVGIDGFPIIAFRNVDNKLSFISKMNFNNDKGNEEVYGLNEGDESWEITNNNTEPALFREELTEDNWKLSFEARFPDVGDDADITRLKDMVDWVVSTRRDTATNTTLKEPVTFTYTEVYLGEDSTYSSREVQKTFTQDNAEYRLAKFKSEFEDRFDLNSTLMYYIFTELFLMVDSRAKNAFPTYFRSRTTGDGGNKWFWLPYDMDTALGINNEGALVFDYNLEDIDLLDNGAYVFNGQTSTLWCNVRDAFYGEISELYAELRKSGRLLSFDNVETRFEEHQNKWSETIFNEDAYEKYIVPLIDNGIDYLDMLQGSKTEQRRWWLYNRFKYMDSKFNAGEAKADTIVLRAYGKDDITITPYADIYASVKYGNTGVVSKRASRGKSCVLKNPLSVVNDTEYTIYSASQLKSVGDLSKANIGGVVDFSKAVKIQDLTLGSSERTNTTLTRITLGNNKLLKTLNLTNCVNLNSTVDISNCSNIEEVYCSNTQIPNIVLPVGGNLKKLYLPDTLKILTIRNQTRLETLEIAGTDEVEKLWLENVPASVVNPYKLITDMKKNAEVRITDMNTTMTVAQIDTFYNALKRFNGLDESGQTVNGPVVSGVIHVDTISYKDYMRLKVVFPLITISPSRIICSVNFFNEDAIFNTQLIALGKNASNPGIPQKTSTAEFDYEFNSWDASYLNIQSDMNIKAIYNSIRRKYIVTFNTQSSTIVATPSTREVLYGNKVIAPTFSDVPEDVNLLGWFKHDGSEFDISQDLIYGPLTLYARWEDTSVPTVNVSRVSHDTFKFIAKDNVGVTNWKVTKSAETPNDWEEIDPITLFEHNYSIESSGKWYVHVSDAGQNTSYTAINSHNVSINKSTGISAVNLYDISNNEKTSTYILSGTKVKIEVVLDSHYKDAVIKLNNNTISNNYTTLITSDISITATCTPKSYNVSFDTSNKGNDYESQTIVYDNLIRAPLPQVVNIDNINYIIGGWFKESTFVNEWNFKKDKVDSDITLYAKWIEYVEPSVLTIDTNKITTENKNIIVNFYQSVSRGVKISWGDDTLEDVYEGTGQVSALHTYSTDGVYNIEILCTNGTYLLGTNSDYCAISPIECLTDISFSWDMPYTRPRAFKGATGLTSVTLTDYMTLVAVGTFENCSNITSVTIPNNIIQIQADAFRNCCNLSTITIDKDFSILSSIGSSAFSNNTALQSLTLPKSLVIINEYAFYNCNVLQTINFEELNNLTTLSGAVFSGCSSLKEAELTESVTSIGYQAFLNCESLTKVTLKNENVTVGSSWIAGASLLTSVGPLNSNSTIEYCWKNIPLEAFAGHSYIEEVTIGDFVNSIGNKAFMNCTALTTLTINQGGVYTSRTIGDSAFEGCDNLLSVEIPSYFTSMGKNVFAYCASLRNISLYNASSVFKVNICEDSWFYRCSNNMTVHCISSNTFDSTLSQYGSSWYFYYDDCPLEIIFDL